MSDNDQFIARHQQYFQHQSQQRLARCQQDFQRLGNRKLKKDMEGSVLSMLFDQGTLENFEKKAGALQKGSYATDPNYAQNLKAVFNGPTMQRGIALAEGNEIQGTSVASVPTQTDRSIYTHGIASAMARSTRPEATSPTITPRRFR